MFELPKWFSEEGIAPGDKGEPITGSRKLSDFANINQLGCCIVFPHNIWHDLIGGSMSFTSTAINDPIFFFGVHWYIDNVFDEYKKLIKKEEPTFKTFDKMKEFSFEKKQIELPAAFTEEETNFFDRAAAHAEFARQNIKLSTLKSK